MRYLCVALASALLLMTWAYRVKSDRLEDAQADNALLRSAIASRDVTIGALQWDVATKDTAIKNRDARLEELRAATIDTAIEIQGAYNDSPSNDIDAPLPLSLSQPLRILFAKAADNNSPATNTNAPAVNAVSAKADTRTATHDDAAHSRAVDSAATRLGN